MPYTGGQKLLKALSKGMSKAFSRSWKTVEVIYNWLC